MARVKGGIMAHKRRKKVLKLAKGFYGAKSKQFRTAKQAVMKSGQYAYIGRKNRKRDFRRLWIIRISAACRLNDINYSTFMNGLKKAGIELNRKMLSEIAIADPKAFAELVATAKKGLDGKIKAAKVEAKKEVEVVKATAKKETKKEEVKEDKKVEKKAAPKKAAAKKEEKVEKAPAKKAPAKATEKKTATKTTTAKKTTKKETK